MVDYKGKDQQVTRPQQVAVTPQNPKRPVQDAADAQDDRGLQFGSFAHSERPPSDTPYLTALRRSASTAMDAKVEQPVTPPAQQTTTSTASPQESTEVSPYQHFEEIKWRTYAIGLKWDVNFPTIKFVLDHPDMDDPDTQSVMHDYGLLVGYYQYIMLVGPQLPESEHAEWKAMSRRVWELAHAISNRLQEAHEKQRVENMFGFSSMLGEDEQAGSDAQPFGDLIILKE
jgi:hypothetical protein